MNMVVRGMLNVGCFVVVGSLVCLALARRGSAQFVVSGIAAGLGLAVVLAAVVIARRTFPELQRRRNDDGIV